MNKPLGTDCNSWVITSDNIIKTNNETEYNLSQQIQEGDIIVSIYMSVHCWPGGIFIFCFAFQGFTYDHVELNFFLNGVNINCPILGIKGTVFPVLFGKNVIYLTSIYVCLSCCLFKHSGKGL